MPTKMKKITQNYKDVRDGSNPANDPCGTGVADENIKQLSLPRLPGFTPQIGCMVALLSWLAVIVHPIVNRMRGRSYSYSPSPPRHYHRRGCSPSLRGRYGGCGGRDMPTSLLVHNLRHGCNRYDRRSPRPSRSVWYSRSRSPRYSRSPPPCHGRSRSRSHSYHSPLPRRCSHLRSPPRKNSICLLLLRIKATHLFRGSKITQGQYHLMIKGTVGNNLTLAVLWIMCQGAGAPIKKRKKKGREQSRLAS